MDNLPSVLKVLGGGAIGALTSHDPRVGMAEARINGPLIQYVGAQSTACTALPDLPQTAYRGRPTSILGDAAAPAAGSSPFQSTQGTTDAIRQAAEVHARPYKTSVPLTHPTSEANRH